MGTILTCLQVQNLVGDRQVGDPTTLEDLERDDREPSIVEELLPPPPKRARPVPEPYNSEEEEEAVPAHLETIIAKAIRREVKFRALLFKAKKTAKLGPGADVGETEGDGTKWYFEEVHLINLYHCAPLMLNNPNDNSTPFPPFLPDRLWILSGHQILCRPMEKINQTGQEFQLHLANQVGLVGQVNQDLPENKAQHMGLGMRIAKLTVLISPAMQPRPPNPKISKKTHCANMQGGMWMRYRRGKGERSTYRSAQNSRETWQALQRSKAKTQRPNYFKSDRPWVLVGLEGLVDHLYPVDKKYQASLLLQVLLPGLAALEFQASQAPLTGQGFLLAPALRWHVLILQEEEITWPGGPTCPGMPGTPDGPGGPGGDIKDLVAVLEIPVGQLLQEDLALHDYLASPKLLGCASAILTRGPFSPGFPIRPGSPYGKKKEHDCYLNARGQCFSILIVSFTSSTSGSIARKTAANPSSAAMSSALPRWMIHRGHWQAPLPPLTDCLNLAQRKHYVILHWSQGDAVVHDWLLPSPLLESGFLQSPQKGNLEEILHVNYSLEIVQS
ncbi:hypothetical protein L345_08923, partial [Ophiophagus hannah]